MGITEMFSGFLHGRTVRYDRRAFVTQGRDGDSRDWKTYESRRTRQAIYWSHYESTIYDDTNSWIGRLKADNGLYEYIRPIYNPAYRLGEFWANHIFGGSLDPAAGPGDTVPSAIPVDTTSDAIRAAISLVWDTSNWQVNKETLSRFGAVMGDTYGTIEDNPDQGKVAIRVLDPRTIWDLEKDSFGNVLSYVITEMRPDPRIPFEERSAVAPQYVEYREICRRNGPVVVYQTFLDGQPFDWNDPGRNGRAPRSPVWSEEYGFVPLVHIQHKDIGLEWGAGEMFGLLSKIYELDDQASKLGDQVRKSVDPPWFFSGVNPDDLTEEDNETRVDDHGGPRGRNAENRKGRDKAAIIATPEANAKAQPLVAPLDLAGVMLNIQGIMKTIEQQHPELVIDNSLAGDASGKALRTAREKAETLVIQRRAMYDRGLVTLHKMAIAIGVQKGYPGFDAFAPDCYETGELNHTIGPRPVFAMNEGERLEQETDRATLVKTFVEAGVPLVVAWRRAGYPESEVKTLIAEREIELQYKLQAIQLQQKQAAADGASYGQHGTLQQ